MKGIIVFSLLLVIFNLLSFSQNPNWTVYNTSNSGLPGDTVWAIAIKAQGIV